MNVYLLSHRTETRIGAARSAIEGVGKAFANLTAPTQRAAAALLRFDLKARSLQTVSMARYSVWTTPLWGERRLLGYVSAPMRRQIWQDDLPNTARATRAALRAARVLWEDADTVKLEQ